MTEEKKDDIICGPYEIEKGGVKKTFCILTDNSVSMRTYNDSVLTKTKVLNNINFEEAMEKFQQKHLKKLNKGFKPSGKFATYRGNVLAEPKRV